MTKGCFKQFVTPSPICIYYWYTAPFPRAKPQKCSGTAPLKCNFSNRALDINLLCMMYTKKALCNLAKSTHIFSGFPLLNQTHGSQVKLSSCWGLLLQFSPPFFSTFSLPPLFLTTCLGQQQRLLPIVRGRGCIAAFKAH